MNMYIEAWIMLCILVAIFGLLIWNKFPVWMVFAGAFTVSLTLGLAPSQDMLNGFANSGVITVAALYPVAAGIYSTGAITLISQHFIGLPKSLKAAYSKIIPPTVIGSSFLSNTALVAMMIPVVRDITRMTGLPGSKIYMFLSFSAQLGGTITLIGTSSSLIVAGLVTDAISSGRLQNMEPITIFEPTLIALPAAAAGILFMTLVASRLLPEHKVEAADQDTKRMYLAEFLVIPSSTLAEKAVEEAGFAQPTGYRLVSIVKPDGTSIPVSPTARLNGNDRLIFIAEADAVPALWGTIGLKPAYASGPKAEKDTYKHSLVEVIISPRATQVGHRISELPLPDSPYNAQLIGISRKGQAPEMSLIDLRLEPGDGAIIEVSDEFFYENRRELDFSVEKLLEGYSVQRVERAATAAAITAAMVLLAAFGVMSMLNAALLAGLAMLITGCISAQRAFQSIDWEIVVVLGLAVGLTAPIMDTGLAQSLSDLFLAKGSENPAAALAAVFIGCLIMTNLVTNTAAASIMFPIALSLANSMELNFLPFAMVMMMAVSYAFINPAGYQTNLMVQKPGQYTVGDYAKVGIPLTIVVGIVVMILAPILYGF